MEDNNRFSILKLEKDVLEYHQYKIKFNEYNNKLKSSCLYYSHYNRKKDFYYNKYINKMKYLENNYRLIHNYTQFHRQLENNYYDDIPVVATAIPSAPPAIAPVFYDD